MGVAEHHQRTAVPGGPVQAEFRVVIMGAFALGNVPPVPGDVAGGERVLEKVNGERLSCQDSSGPLRAIGALGGGPPLGQGQRNKYSRGSSEARVMRKWPLLASAREAYSGSADWSLRFEMAHSLSFASLLLAFSSPTLVSAAALATLRIQPLVRILATN